MQGSKSDCRQVMAWFEWADGEEYLPPVTARTLPLSLVCMGSVCDGPAATLGEQLGVEMTLSNEGKKQENSWLSFITGGGEKHLFLRSLSWPQTILTTKTVCLSFFFFFQSLGKLNDCHQRCSKNIQADLRTAPGRQWGPCRRWQTRLRSQQNPVQGCKALSVSLQQRVSNLEVLIKTLEQ